MYRLCEKQIAWRALQVLFAAVLLQDFPLLFVDEFGFSFPVVLRENEHLGWICLRMRVHSLPTEVPREY